MYVNVHVTVHDLEKLMDVFRSALVKEYHKETGILFVSVEMSHILSTIILATKIMTTANRKTVAKRKSRVNPRLMKKKKNLQKNQMKADLTILLLTHRQHQKVKNMLQKKKLSIFRNLKKLLKPLIPKVIF